MVYSICTTLLVGNSGELSKVRFLTYLYSGPWWAEVNHLRWRSIRHNVPGGLSLRGSGWRSIRYGIPDPRRYDSPGGFWCGSIPQLSDALLLEYSVIR